jgi:hypothetical protein
MARVLVRATAAVVMIKRARFMGQIPFLELTMILAR